MPNLTHPRRFPSAKAGHTCMANLGTPSTNLQITGQCAVIYSEFLLIARDRLLARGNWQTVGFRAG